MSPVDYEKVILNKLPSVRKACSFTKKTSVDKGDRSIEHGPAPRKPAGVRSCANEYPPLPLTTLPKQKRQRERTAEPPRNTIPQNHRMCSLTEHLHVSLKGGHGKVFDPFWGGRFSKPVGYPKGWKHGGFGDTFDRIGLTSSENVISCPE